MAREPRDDGTYSSPNNHGPQLVPATELEEAVSTVLRMFDKYVTAALLQEYLAVLADQRPEDVHEACKAWVRHPPENRAPRAHELRTRAAELRPASVPAPVSLPTGPTASELRCQHREGPPGEDGERPQCHGRVPWPPGRDDAARIYCPQHRALYQPSHLAATPEDVHALVQGFLRRHTLPTTGELSDAEAQDVKQRQLAQARAQGMLP